MQFISLLCFLCYLFEWESVCLYLYKYMQVCVFIGTNDMITTNGRLGLPFPSCWNVAATTAIVVLTIRDMNDDGNKVEKWFSIERPKHVEWKYEIWWRLHWRRRCYLLSNWFPSCHVINLIWHPWTPVGNNNGEW